MKISAVIAAAGLSSRMRDFKPLVQVGGETIVGRMVRSMREAGIGEIVVVGGYRGEELQRALEPLGVRVVLNRSYAETQMLHSLKIGIASLTEPYDRLFLSPGDVPLVRAETLRAMAKQPGQAVRPICGGETGHPLLLDRELVPPLLDYKDGGGLDGALRKLAAHVVDLPVDDRGCTLDIDTHEDLMELRRTYSVESGGDGFWPEVQIKIGRGGWLFGPEDAQFLEMIARTGSIQRSCACVHISYTRGWTRLRDMERELGMKLTERSTGGADGGGTVLTADGTALLTAYRRFLTELLSDGHAAFHRAFDELNGRLTGEAADK